MSSSQNMYRKDILILNQPYIAKEDQFYFQLFRIPEVMNRLKQYRKVLNENDITVPLWVYSLTEELKVLTEDTQQPFILNFLINLGFFDRYISHKGWPQYIVGSDPLISVLVGEVSFEEEVLLMSHGYCHESSKVQIYKVSSYYKRQTGSFYLNNLKKLKAGYTLEDCLKFFKASLKKDWGSWFFQLLAPHEESFMLELRTKDIFARDFLEADSSLKWLWPSWKKAQLKHLKSKLSQAIF